MGTFITAYAIIWLSMALYVLRLRAHQRRLELIAGALRSRLPRGGDGAEIAIDSSRN